MGCDIHIFAEVKKQWPNRAVKPMWEVVGKVFKASYYRKNESTTISGTKKDNYEVNPVYTEEPYGGRNYDLFAILANVRNGYGFAGVDTGDGFKSIDMPRGVPKDASQYYKSIVRSWGENGHSHSYFNVQELLDYDWSQTTKKRGFVTKSQYAIFKELGKPKEWCGGIIGQGIKIVSNQEMDKLPSNDVQKDKLEYYTQVEWEETYMESAEKFLSETIPALKGLLKKKDVLDVRIVFFFDN